MPKATDKAKAKAKTTKKPRKKTAGKENGEEQRIEDVTMADSINSSVSRGQGPMSTILSNAQLNETFHKRYIKELKQLYSKLDHEEFMVTFIKMLKTVLEAEEGNEYGNTALTFCAKFVTSFESETTHPVLADTFAWLLSSISNSPHIRYRICFSVNLILKHMGPQAALDDSKCDQILYYMLDRVKDISPSVRKEAVLAMQRLQMPDKPDDMVVCAYQFHLSSDPSPSVRQCIITCMGRNYLTLPHILQRLWDVDEKVRRHTYINMCNYPVRSYKVSQRLTIVERGLNDTSENVRKQFIKYMLKSWIDTYQQNYIQLIAALKLDSSEEALMRFRSVTRKMLFVIFEQEDNSELLSQLPLSEDCELHRCVPLESLTVELLLYWQYLSAYLQHTLADEYELVLPELSVFCDYVEKFCQFQKPDMDKFAQIEFQCMLLSLVEMLQSYDLGDEIGRANLKALITHLLRECLLDHKIVGILVRCMEQIVSDIPERMQFFIKIIYEICELSVKQNDLVHDRSLIDKLLDDVDTSLVTEINSLKVKILELEELEENFVSQKEYMRAQAVNDEKIAVTNQYTDLIQPLLEKHGVLQLPARPKISKQERILKGLYIAYHMVVSENVRSLNPSICKLYKDFICRHLASAETDIFEWAIKCGTAYSILYEAYTKEVFDAVVYQFYKDNNLRLGETSAQCILELMDHYGVDYFMELNEAAVGANAKTSRRLLYTMQDFFDGEDDQSQNNEQSQDIFVLMGMYVERVGDKGILLIIVRGLCRLFLRGQLDNRTDVLEKLLKRYFNPNTEPMVSQVLGMFFENLVQQKRQNLLVPCMLPVVWSFMSHKYDSPLHDVMPDHVIKFFIDMTLQEKSTPENNIHNKIAISFLQYIHNYYTERKEMCRVLAKEMITLQLNLVNSPQLKTQLLELIDNLSNTELEPRMIRSINDFKGLVNGSFNPPPRKTTGNESDFDADECESVAATVVSAPECTTQPAEEPAAEPTQDETTLTQENAVASTAATPVPTPAATPVPTPAADANKTSTQPEASVETTSKVVEPVLTTYGSKNEVGIRFLRRSLYNSMSQSENESICGSQTPTRETEAGAKAIEKQQEKQKVSEITRKKLGRPRTKQRLEQAMAPKTPERTPEPAQVAEKESEPQPEATPVAKVTQTSRILNATTTEAHDDSEIIDMSSTEESPSNATQTARSLRLRSMRKRNASASTTGNARNSSTGSGTGSKGKVLHLEIQTPLRNGRKRVLRKSLRTPSRGATQSSDSTTPSQQISPLPKQQRLDKPRVSTKKMTPAKAKSTASPSGSSTSSLKENTKPAERSVHRTPQASRRTSILSNSSTPLNRTITRHSARKQRKRLSQDISLTEGHLKVSTPKRVRKEQQANEERANRSRATRCIVRIATIHTRAVAAEAAPVAARTRRQPPTTPKP